MELSFKPERLTILKRLLGFSITEIQRQMGNQVKDGTIKKINIDRWEQPNWNPRFDKVELLAKTLGIPVGVFYYNTVEFELKNNIVTIHIPDTKETLAFDFLTGNKLPYKHS